MSNTTVSAATVDYMFDPSLVNFDKLITATVAEKADDARSLTEAGAINYEEGALTVIGIFNASFQAFLEGLGEIAGRDSLEYEAAVVMIEGVEEYANAHLTTLRDAVFEAKGSTLESERAALKAREVEAIGDLLDQLVAAGV